MSVSELLHDHYFTPLNLNSSTVLITGGGNGIGYSLVQKFLQAGSTVIISDCREDRLKDAKEKLNSDRLHCHLGDIGKENDRIELFHWIITHYPSMNILVNNAGIQRRISMMNDFNTPWSERQKEIDINFSAPVHLCSLFIPHLLKGKQQSAIINITSDLAFIPPAFAPVYGATKAYVYPYIMQSSSALHNFTVSLRFDLNNSNIDVYEIIPPPVRTDLGGGHPFGEPVDEFTDHIFERIKSGEQEIGYKKSNENRLASREQINQTFLELNTNYKHMFPSNT
ncbi:unnamed protein product [Didymodactylos carnosus]|uniref:Uncharacterized protein n=1 Tax=Didymodactylos carnosus TaxID=1234261 RepID=A0A815FGD7_9BILA|nr:unnamed protein product [Didymodactylos carnosus]CAF4173898.1 unnamed protein product [Didymodactylos carnosus]